MKSNLQIISGKYRGKKLLLPHDARPTQNIARGALFNMLNEILDNSEKISVWDAFGGSGAFGIECLSRFDKPMVLGPTHEELFTLAAKNMKRITTLLVLISLMFTSTMAQNNVYDFTVKDNKGNDVSLAQYKGKVLLIVNTATACGFTPQYAELEALYEAYAEKGLEILDFPCNQFGAQASGTDEEIHSFCTLNFGTKFPRFKKIDVNGDNEQPLYTYLKSKKGFAGFDPAHPLTKILDDMFSKADADYAKKPDVKWNFTKFLIDQEGKVIARFEPTATKEVLAPAIEALLK